MQRIRRLQGTLRPESDFDRAMEDFVAKLSQQLDDLLYRGLKFSENFNSNLVSFTSHATPDTEFSITHTLERVPTGRVILHQSKAGNLYQGPATGTAWTVSLAYFKCDVASVAFYVMLF